VAVAIGPEQGGFLGPFGCSWFIREFLMGYSPEGAGVINHEREATQTDINYAYKEALDKATTRERAERIISRMVVDGVDVIEDKAGNIYQRELKRISRKFTHMRYRSFLVYFGVLKSLGWVAETGYTEPSTIQDYHSPAPDRVYYRLAEKGKEAPGEYWSNPLFTLYPEIGPSRMK